MPVGTRFANVILTTALLWGAPAVSYAGPALGPGTLLEGSRAFREGRYAEALVSFRVAERVSGLGLEALWYSAATLYKLGRIDEALEAFDRAFREAPELGDAVLEFYFCSAAYEARLYLVADDRLASLLPRAGPKLGAEVQRLRDRIAPLFASAPEARTVDWYLARAAQLRETRRPLLARLHYVEAAALARRRMPSYRLEDATKGVAETSPGSAP